MYLSGKVAFSIRIVVGALCSSLSNSTKPSTKKNNNNNAMGESFVCSLSRVVSSSLISALISVAEHEQQSTNATDSTLNSSLAAILTCSVCHERHFDHS